jgi:hypothetical protein
VALEQEAHPWTVSVMIAATRPVVRIVRRMVGKGMDKWLRIQRFDCKASLCKKYLREVMR